MDIVLWVLQLVLGLAFVAAGFLHSIQYERSRERLAWVQALPRRLVRTIGVLEILGGIGLVLAAATGLLPWLTPLAAACLGVLMAPAIVFHARRGEWPNIGINAVLGALALAVAYGRLAVLRFS